MSCLCSRCQRDNPPWVQYMPACPTCGNKRCPKGTDHRLDCTGSNEPGQPGSGYGVLLPEMTDGAA